MPVIAVRTPALTQRFTEPPKTQAGICIALVRRATPEGTASAIVRL